MASPDAERGSGNNWASSPSWAREPLKLKRYISDVGRDAGSRKAAARLPTLPWTDSGLLAVIAAERLRPPPVEKGWQLSEAPKTVTK